MKFEQIRSMVFGFLRIEGSKQKEKLELSEEDKRQLDAAVKTEGFAEKFQSRHNEKIEAENEINQASEFIASFMEEEDVQTNEETSDVNLNGDQIPSAEGAQNKLVGKVKSLGNALKAERTKRKKLEAENKKLAASPEPDEPEIIQYDNSNAMKHSSTHLFGSTASYDAFEGRNWNKLAASIPGATSTEWNSMDIDQLNKDIQNYFRKDPKKLHDLMLDALELPKHWKLISNVSDEYTDVFVTIGEVTQGIKKAWLPKNKVKFTANIGKVRDIQIDLEFDGYELKKMEKSYLNHFFNEGSKPVKMSFVLFVVEKVLKKARKEDKICIGRGVYVPNEGEKPGSYLNNFSGVIKLALDARNKKYRPFKLGKPTKENIYEYINNFVDLIPHEIQNLPDLYFYLSHEWARAYNDARERKKGGNMDYTGKSMVLDNYPNVKLYPYDQLGKSDFMFLTTEDNIKILTDKLGEDKVIKFKEEVRGIKGAGDYKLAAYIQVFGRNLVDTPDNSFEDQLFFSNDVEALTDVYAPVQANDATPTLEYHTSLIIGENNTNNTTVITGFKEAVPGTKIYLRGNSDTTYSTIKTAANISLIDGECQLKNNQLLVLYVKPDGTFQELKREIIGGESIEEAKIVISPNQSVLDAISGSYFVTSENTEATAITSIVNVQEEDQITIEGGSGTTSTTISPTDTIKIGSTFTLSEGNWIKLYFNGSVFVELERFTTAA